MIEPFPVSSLHEVLTVNDFQRFSNSFASILMKQLPTVTKVDFIFSEGDFVKRYKKITQIIALLPEFRAVLRGDKLCLIHETCLFIPFQVRNDKRVIAVIPQMDSLFQQKLSADWLLENAYIAEREFLLLKQARVDIQTGLLNLLNLQYLLETSTDTKGLHLILVELPPQRSSFRSVLRHSQKCTTLLLNYIQGETVLHYIGQCTFALVLQHNLDWPKQEIESGLVSYLKREGCHRVHVGSMLARGSGTEEGSHHNGGQLLDEAWTALCHARRRGPFTFCDYNLLAHPEQHPLAPPDRNIIRRINKLSVNSDFFCLIQFRCNKKTDHSRNFVLAHIDRGEVFFSAGDIFVFIDKVSDNEIFPWVSDTVRLMQEKQDDIHISAGVSSYPYCDYKKSEMVFNCKKALLHADLLGSSAVAVFDGLSLNISGDIYFGDGNLAKAVKEYRRGLKCDEKNINLHNSLGVSLVMMNKLTLALASFARALELESNNFMALYNYGLTAQALGLKKKALSFLQRALENFSDEDGGTEVDNELKLQIAILSCEIKQYNVALDFLVPWYHHNSKKQRAERVHYYLGETYHALGDNSNAMQSLQRALRFNEFDDRAMHLLGRVYLAEKEGDTIALSLCQKSVELEPSNIQYRFHLATVQLHCGMVEEARTNLRRCLRNKEYQVRAQLYMARSYREKHQLAKAKIWYRKILSREKVKIKYKKEALELLN